MAHTEATNAGLRYCEPSVEESTSMQNCPNYNVVFFELQPRIVDYVSNLIAMMVRPSGG
ncbi:MAG: hypothetical protein HOP23_11885 [Methylococcaceae bacterium]|nr:hypothetical protein [Methylococcaceae bacterium]